MGATDMVLQVIGAFDKAGVASKGGRPAKDVEDVSKILSVGWQELDQGYIRNWADQHGTRELFDQLLAKAQAKV